MRILRGERGAALVTALMLTMLALVISMMLLYSVISDIKVSASQRRYKSALAAAHGGVELLGQEIIPRLFQSVTRDMLEEEFRLVGLTVPHYECLRQKIDSPADQWLACEAEEKSADPEQSPDASFRLNDSGGRGGFRVLTKIVDTIPGNTDRSGIDYLDAGVSMAAKEEVVHPAHIPSIYNLSVQGSRDEGAAREKARLSVLYAY